MKLAVIGAIVFVGLLVWVMLHTPTCDQPAKYLSPNQLKTCGL